MEVILNNSKAMNYSLLKQNLHFEKDIFQYHAGNTFRYTNYKTQRTKSKQIFSLFCRFLGNSAHFRNKSR